MPDRGPYSTRDFGTSRISFSPHVQTKRVSAKATFWQTSQTCLLPHKANASLFWQRFCSYPKCIFLGLWKRMGWRAFRWGGGGNVWLKTAFPGTAGTIGRGGVNLWSKEGRGENVPKFWPPEIKKRSHPEPTTIFNHCLHRTLFWPWVAVVTS